RLPASEYVLSPHRRKKSSPPAYALVGRTSRAGESGQRSMAVASSPKLVLPPSRSRRARPTKYFGGGSTSSRVIVPAVASNTVARSRAVRASSTPTDQPPAGRPLTLAAPRIVVLVGMSSKSPDDGSPWGSRPMRRE